VRRAWLIGVLLVGASAGAEPGAAGSPGGTLTFAPGHSALDGMTRHTLDPLRDQLRTCSQLHVRLVSAETADPSLASRRAEAAKWYLVDGGVEVDRIESATSAAVVARDALQVRVVGAPCAAPAPSKGGIVADASELANLLAGGEPESSPKSLARPLPAAPTVHVGNDDVGFRGDASLHATVSAGLPLALAALRGTYAEHHEDDLAREALATQPQHDKSGKLKLDSREMRELSRCYRKALAFDPDTSNQVDLSFSIDRKGRVVSPMAVSDSGELDACLNAAMSRWRFPGRGGKGRIWLSVVLAPR